MLRVDKLPLAEEDLIDIWAYGYDTWGETQADKYADSLEDMIKSIASSPKKHRLRTEFRPSVRICPHISHIIIYKIKEDSIVIIRVLHKSMDVPLHI